MANSNLKIYTPCWGKKHIMLFRRCLGLSLSWPKNNAFIHGAEWIVPCETEEDAQGLFQVIKAINPFCSVTAHVHPEISKVDSGMALIDSLVMTIKSCISENKALLMATPDFIFGEGTLDAFRSVAHEPGHVVSIAHMRVLPGLLSELKTPLTNPQLVSLGQKYAHVTWSEANERFYYGGMRWKKHGNMFCVEHHMPSPFYATFIDQDVKDFTGLQHGKLPGFGAWDHYWPTHLLEQGRLRIIGSSDLAVLLEVTDPDKNVPPIDDRPGFVHKHSHNNIQKQFISVFRGE